MVATGRRYLSGTEGLLSTSTLPEEVIEDNIVIILDVKDNEEATRYHHYGARVPSRHVWDGPGVLSRIGSRTVEWNPVESDNRSDEYREKIKVLKDESEVEIFDVGNGTQSVKGKGNFFGFQVLTRKKQQPLVVEAHILTGIAANAALARLNGPEEANVENDDRLDSVLSEILSTSTDSEVTTEGRESDQRDFKTLIRDVNGGTVVSYGRIPLFSEVRSSSYLDSLLATKSRKFHQKFSYVWGEKKVRHRKTDRYETLREKERAEKQQSDFSVAANATNISPSALHWVSLWAWSQLAGGLGYFHGTVITKEAGVHCRRRRSVRLLVSHLDGVLCCIR